MLKFGFRLLKSVLIIFLAVGWIFSGWPRIWNEPPLPPPAKEVKAATDWSQCRVESGETTIPAVSASANVTLSTSITDTSQAFLLVDSSGTNGISNEGAHMVAGYIASASTLTFSRGLSSGTAVNITYSLVECFNDEFDVQRGQSTIIAGETATSSSISSVDTSRSMVVVSATSASNVNEERTALVTGELTDSTTVHFEIGATGSYNTVIRWEVVTFSEDSGVTVQTDEVFLDQGASSVTDTVTSVTTGRSWLYCSWNAAMAGLQQSAIGCELTNGTTITFYRHATNNYENYIRYYLVQFPANTVSVQRGTDSYTSNGIDGNRYNKDITITAVNATTKAFPFVTNTTSGVATAFPRNKWIEQLTSTTNLRLSFWRQVSSGTTANTGFYWQVVEFLPGTITVSSTGSQTGSIYISSTGNYVGGAFTFSRNTGSANVTSITIDEEGTVDAVADLSNLKLYYETSGACTYDGGETLFGTASSFSTGDKATITGTMAVGTSQVCLYAVVDVGSGASSGETLELEITDPSAISVSAGTIGPGTAVALSGTTQLVIVSISVSDGTVAYGTVPLSEQEDTVSLGGTNPQTMTNDGSATITVNVKSSQATGGTQWTMASSAGSDQFVHEFSTTTGSTWTIFDTNPNTYKTATTSVAPGNSEDLDLRITAPTASTDNQQKTITVTVQAVGE